MRRDFRQEYQLGSQPPQQTGMTRKESGNNGGEVTTGDEVTAGGEVTTADETMATAAVLPLRPRLPTTN